MINNKVSKKVINNKVQKIKLRWNNVKSFNKFKFVDLNLTSVAI